MSVPEKKAFSFDLLARNQMLETNGFKFPSAFKTGTTIVGLVYKDGVVLGADTRATGGSIVCDKNCQKIHYIAPNIYCCGAGTAADTENTTAMISSQLELLSMNTGKPALVVAAMTMLKRFLFKYQGYISAALVLGGVDETGPHLYSIHPHGSTSKLPYLTMGSGSLAAMSVFEAGYKPNLELDEAMHLVHQAIRAGIFNDLGSGSNVDLCVITKEGAKMHRTYDEANPRPFKRQYYFSPGTTPVWHDLSRLAVQEEDAVME
eukprot:c8333_g1_i1.p1 GENE.c8333_g1_i1~~c8333_g1_i1.p1  ORF type:complete len:262 (+),score=96.57 c8333_g1_i1:60-845(+)